MADSEASRDGGSPNRRVSVLDTFRGLVILSMIGFHACYDMVYLLGWSIPWFSDGTFQDVWRCSISWSFLLLAGWMTSCSRSNARRALRYGVVAVVVFLATYITRIDTPVSFGIIYCMAASTALYALLEPGLNRLSRTQSIIAGIILCLAFLLLRDVPRHAYPVTGLSWLGFPSPTFASGDYYPLVPYALLYLAGALWAHGYQMGMSRGSHAGRANHVDGLRRATIRAYPAWMYRDYLPPVTALGRHSLLAYLLHQPLLIALFMLVGNP